MFRSPVPVSVLLVPLVPIVSLGFFLLPRFPVAAVLPANPSGASKPYLRRMNVPLEFLCVLTCDYPPLPPSTVPRDALGGATGSCPLTMFTLHLVAVAPSVSPVAK